jgi:dTDP-4-dehydrorhamnose 3,5-epimerase
VLFHETSLTGVFVVEPQRLEDERGFFARVFCSREFEEHDLNPNFVQCSISFNPVRGTLRGMHYQKAPFQEAKLVRCTAGSIYDVAIDLRDGSDTFGRWFGVELSAANRRSLYIPEGFAHGFQTLEDNVEVFYQITEYYHPECGARVAWDDPAFNIKWPLLPTVVSPADSAAIRTEK